MRSGKLLHSLCLYQVQKPNFGSPSTSAQSTPQQSSSPGHCGPSTLRYKISLAASSLRHLTFAQAIGNSPSIRTPTNTCGIVCPQGTYSSTRALPGLKNATAYFQFTVEPLFQAFRSSVKAWLDDFNLHAESEDLLLSHLTKFFSICRKYNLFLSATKCKFFAKEIKWCGHMKKWYWV